MQEPPRKRKPWGARSEEDHLLAAHRERCRPEATVFAQVKLGGRGKRSRWKSSRQRLVDGVLARPGTSAGIMRRQAFLDRLREGPPVDAVELWQVDLAVTEEAIGHAVAALCLWPAQYGIVVDRTVLVTCGIDPALAWVCARLGLEVVVESMPHAQPRARRVARGATGLDVARVHRIDPWRRGVGGTFVTGIPLAGADSGVDAWEGATQVHLDLLRVPDGPVDALVLYDTPDRLLALVDDRPVEVVEVRRELRPGSIGRVLAQASMLEAQYELAVARRVIVCDKGDEALEWACARLDIVVEKP